MSWLRRLGQSNDVNFSASLATVSSGVASVHGDCVTAEEAFAAWDHLARYEDFTRAPSLMTYFFWLNTKQKPLDDVRVRRALSLAVDRASLVRYVTRGGQIPSADLVPDGLADYRGPRTPIFDKQAAQQPEPGQPAQGNPFTLPS